MKKSDRETLDSDGRGRMANMAGLTYQEWDTQRHESWPLAKHTHWNSFLGTLNVAEWNPHSGRCWVMREIERARDASDCHTYS